MKPYYEHAGITIYHGDCREIMPSLGLVPESRNGPPTWCICGSDGPPIDLLVTDPPYGLGEARGRNKSRSVLAVAKNFGMATWDDAPAARWLLDWHREITRSQIIWGGNFFGLPPASCWLVWDKDNGENDFADCELAWTNLPKAVRRIRYRWQGMLQERMGEAKEERWHPTQKPLSVMLWAIQQAPETCHSILDPFMGSGTTLVAAKALGRCAIGIEIEERYCEVAAKRLAQEVLPL